VNAPAWAAPQAHEPVRGTVEVPGSKSMTNRALVLAALADGPSRLVGALVSRDTALMEAGLRSLGVSVELDTSSGELSPTVDVRPGAFRGPATVDCGLAGTVMRFLPPVAGLADGSVHFDGDPRARQRPMAAVLSALRTLGVGIDDAGTGGLPFTVRGAGRIRGGPVEIDGSASSQFISALLLAGFRFDEGVTVKHRGAQLPSVPYVDMTVAMLRESGVAVHAGQLDELDTWRVEPGRIIGREVRIEPDLSNAAPFLAAALVTQGTVIVRGWPSRTVQPGDQLRDLFAEMGGRVDLGPAGLTLTGTGTITGLDRDLRDVGELVPVISAVAALADTPSHLRGIGHLRGHETDRLAAIATELRALGAIVDEGPDDLIITPARMRGGIFETYADHRMAQAGAVLGLAVPGLLVADIATTAKTLPNFASMWEDLVNPAELRPDLTRAR